MALMLPTDIFNYANFNYLKGFSYEATETFIMGMFF